MLPGDATWRYNLACSLAYREKPDAALKELERAIDLGFRNADEIARDTDLARIAHLPRFAALVQKARDLSGRPVAGRPAPAPLYAATGAAATLTETNLVFNFDTGAAASNAENKGRCTVFGYYVQDPERRKEQMQSITQFNSSILPLV